MTKHKMPDMKEGGVNVTPLIDVVMCLIIFFMLVAKIGVSSGIDAKIDSPTTYLGVKIADMGNTLALNVMPKIGGGLFEPPMVTANVKGEAKDLPIQIDQGGKTVHPLREVLQAFKAERKEGAKVIINIGKEMKYAQIQLVLQECAVAGITNLNFVTKKATSEAVAGQ